MLQSERGEFASEFLGVVRRHGARGNHDRTGLHLLRHAVLAARMDVIAAARAGLPVTERLYLESLARTHDAAEGVAAFLAKRPAVWRDD